MGLVLTDLKRMKRRIWRICSVRCYSRFFWVTLLFTPFYLDPCSAMKTLTCTEEESRPSTWTEADNVCPGFQNTCGTISTWVVFTSCKLAQFPQVQLWALTKPSLMITKKGKASIKSIREQTFDLLHTHTHTHTQENNNKVCMWSFFFSLSFSVFLNF